MCEKKFGYHWQLNPGPLALTACVLAMGQLRQKFWVWFPAAADFLSSLIIFTLHFLSTSLRFLKAKFAFVAKNRQGGLFQGDVTNLW